MKKQMWGAAKNEVAELKAQLTEVQLQMQQLQINMKGPQQRICIPVMNGITCIQVIDIIYCQSEINYTHLFFTNKQKLLVAKTLKEFEELLKEYNFCRVHNSHLVNLAYVKEYKKSGFITMTNNSIIPVSTRRREEFLNKLINL